MQVLSVLQSKNRCLKKFLACSEAFLRQLEGNDLSEMDAFNRQREHIFAVLPLYDRRIAALNQEITSSFRSNPLSPQSKALQSAIESTTQIIMAIFKIDQEIAKQIEAHKTHLIQDLLQTDKEQSVLQKFKSNWVAESGAKLDGTV